MRIRPLLAVTALALLLASFAGCDSTDIDVFKADDFHFSVIGYLDTSRAKQTLRVEPLQDSIFVGTDSSALRVTLRDVGRGQAVEMAEEPLRFDDLTDLTLRNFSARLPIRPEATYHIVAERLRDGATSEAEVTIPANAPEVQLNTNSVIVSGIERLGALVAYYNNDAGKESLLADTTRRADGSYRVSLLLDRLPLPCKLIRVEAASVSADWPTYLSPVNEGPLPPPGAESNVERGAGYVGGAITRTVVRSTPPCPPDT